MQPSLAAAKACKGNRTQAALVEESPLGMLVLSARFAGRYQGVILITVVDVVVERVEPWSFTLMTLMLSTALGTSLAVTSLVEVATACSVEDVVVVEGHGTMRISLPGSRQIVWPLYWLAGYPHQ